MNNKNLAIILFVLVAIFIGSKFFGGNKTRSFKEDFVRIDTTKVDQITIHPKDQTKSEFSLIRNQNVWRVKSAEGLDVQASTNSINSVLGQLTYIKANRIVARTKEKWEEYEVDESKGTRIELYSSGKKIDDIILGRLYFNQNSRTALSYVRKSNEDDTYAVDGFLNIQISPDLNSYRVKELVQVNTNDINRIMVKAEQYETSTFDKRTEKWYLNNELEVDSTEMVQYLTQFSNLMGVNFYDTALDPSAQAIKTLTIQANNVVGDIEVSCFSHPEEENAYVIHSSMNKEAYFYSDSTGIYKKLFLDLPTTLDQ